MLSRVAHPLLRGVRRQAGGMYMLAEQAKLKGILLFMPASAGVIHTPPLSWHPSERGDTLHATTR